MDIPIFESNEEKIDFQKTRIDSLGLSYRVQNALTGASIRTIGGITRKTEPSLLEIKGLGVRGIEEIKNKLNHFSSLLKDTKKALPEMSASLEGNTLPILKTKEEIINFFNNRVKSLGLSKRTENALINKYIENFSENTENYQSSISDAGIGKLDYLEEKNQEINNTPNLYLSNIYVKKDADTITEFFINYFDIDRKLVKSSTRKKEVIEVRNLIIYFLREYCNTSFVEIGRFFGKDHTTAIHSYQKVRSNKEYINYIEKEFSTLITELESTWSEKKDIRQVVVKEERVKKSKKQEPKYREIPERNINVFKLYKQGLTLEGIAKITGVTRERIRQIAEKTITQIIYNESIQSGITIDIQMALKEEKENRKDIKKINNPTKPIKLRKPKTWSYKYLACSLCGTTTVPHFRKGLCEICGKKSIYGSERENIVIEHDNKCDSCGMLRDEAYAKFGRDFYLSRIDRSVLCKRCHLNTTGKKLGDSRKNKWRMFYK